MVRELIGSRSMTQSDLARQTCTSNAYVSKVLNGVSPPSANWVALVAHAMALGEAEREELKAKAAEVHLRRRGYDVDLTKP
jgi:transcriptional regulator with XRE-family HTH domain